MRFEKGTYYIRTNEGFEQRTGYLYADGIYKFAVGKTGGAWYATDIPTGFSIAGGYRTRADAVDAAHQFVLSGRYKDVRSSAGYEKWRREADEFKRNEGKKRDEGKKRGNKQGKKSSDKGANMGKKRNGFAYFKVDHTTPIENIKRQYRKLAMENHPDMGGDVKTMQAINAEYDKLVKSHYNIHESRKGEVYTDERQTAPDDVTAMFADILDGLIRVLKIDADDIEVCGKFLWLHNTTKFNKHHYKALGFRWSVNKKLWYRSPAGYRGTKHRAWSMDEIRGAYGSYKVDRDENDKAQLPAA